MVMEKIDAAGVIAIFDGIARVMEENKERLGKLDQAIGDGDLGITMAAGFSGAAKDAPGFGEAEPGRMFMKAGMSINRHAPSTMGTVMATGFMRGGKAVAGKEALTSADLAPFFQAFLDGVMERGKVRPGDKTAVDAILPASEAAGAAASKPLPDAMADIAAAAERGREAAKSLMSQHGKAAVFREKTIGMEDPGCAAFCLMIKGFADAVGG